MTLSLATAGAVINGSVSADGQDARLFFGWLELATVLEAARTSAAAEGIKSGCAET